MSEIPNSFDLTDKQETVIRRRAEGQTNKEIAHEMGVSVTSIQEHATAAIKKLSAVNLCNAINIYTQKRYPQPPESQIQHQKGNSSILGILAMVEKQVAELGLEPIAKVKLPEFVGENDLETYLIENGLLDYAAAMLKIISETRKGAK